MELCYLKEALKKIRKNDRNVTKIFWVDTVLFKEAYKKAV